MLISGVQSFAPRFLMLTLNPMTWLEIEHPTADQWLPKRYKTEGKEGKEGKERQHRVDKTSHNFVILLRSFA